MARSKSTPETASAAEEFDRRVTDRTKLRPDEAGTHREQRARERRRRRRRALLTGLAIPVAAALGVIGVKLVSQHIIAAVVAQQYADGDFEGAMNNASQLQWLNVVEPWKAEYDLGTSLLGAGALDEARDAFERALPLASPIDQCPVRANLAITVETQGDDAYFDRDPATAHERYVEALKVITEADPTCSSSSAIGSLDESEERIREKIRRLEEQSPPSPKPDPNENGDPDKQEPGQPKPDALDEIEDQLDDNREERDDRLDEGGGGGYVDKPW